MAKVSIKAAVRRAKHEDKAHRTDDSFQNFALGLGLGTNNATSANGYGLNPITRQRTLLEWMHRGSWIAGVGIDCIADDMTRAGVELKGQLKPGEAERLEEAATGLKIWKRLNSGKKWGDLYGGAILVYLIDGADYSKPLRIETVGKDQFKGLLVLDRWMVQPSLEDLVSDPGPDLGLPKYYTVVADAPALRHQKVHHTRCVRLAGVELPYWQAMAENLWGLSVLERVFDRLSSFDMATTGAAQLAHKSHIRTYKVEKYREILAGGGPAYNGLLMMVQQMRLLQTNEGITLLDSKDTFETFSASNFTGFSDVLVQLGQQLSGAWQIPLVRLFGQSPAGMNSTGESDLRTYYDGVKQRQESDFRIPVTRIYRCIAQSIGIKLDDAFRIEFRPLWQLDEVQKSDVAQKIGATVQGYVDAGLMSPKVGMQEIRQSSRITGVGTNITDEDIEAAADVVAPEPEMVDPDTDPSNLEGSGKPTPETKPTEE